MSTNTTPDHVVSVELTVARGERVIRVAVDDRWDGGEFHPTPDDLASETAALIGGAVDHLLGTTLEGEVGVLPRRGPRSRRELRMSRAELSIAVHHLYNARQGRDRDSEQLAADYALVRDALGFK